MGRKVGVAHSHWDVFMTHQLLHGPQVDASHHEARREGMTQRIEPYPFEMHPLTGLSELRAQGVEMPRAAVIVHQDGCRGAVRVRKETFRFYVYANERGRTELTRALVANSNYLLRP